MRMIRGVRVAVVTFLVLGGAEAKAATIFVDTFEGEALGFNTTLDNWTITNGTVDVVGSGGVWAFLCDGTGGDASPSPGRCVDLDGSSGNAVTMHHDFLLTAGNYSLSYWLSGSERTDTNTLNINVTLGSLAAATHTLGFDAPWTKFTLPFTVVADSTARLTFNHLGNDNVGILLDEVRLDTQVAPVPEPGSLALLGAGLAGLVTRYRRKSGSRM